MHRPQLLAPLTTSWRKAPPDLAISSCGEPNSTSLPASSTMILSASRTDESRCAMVSTVAWPNAERTVRWMSASVSASTEDVASSSSTSEQRESSARAMQRSCRWPAEKLAPSSATGDCSEGTACAICTRRSASHSASSDQAPFGSRLSRTEPEKRVGSCGITATPSRCSSSGVVDTSTPSISTAPLRSGGATSRVIAATREDLPEPVRPTTPTFSPGRTSALTPSSTRGRPSR
mmetsp:Transcript_27059/g.80811  ORF Transcript_27059/g.80811 Transcript_27059/m.80811 type:complete len:234 (-) Transcript_27059:90-791(-)